MEIEHLRKMLAGKYVGFEASAICHSLLYLAERMDNQTAEISHAIDCGVKVLATQLGNIAYLKHVDDLNVLDTLADK